MSEIGNYSKEVRDGVLVYSATGEPVFGDQCEVVQAWVKDSENTVPIAWAETRSTTVAINTAREWKRMGFRVERFWKGENK